MKISTHVKLVLLALIFTVLFGGIVFFMFGSVYNFHISYSGGLGDTVIEELHLPISKGSDFTVEGHYQVGYYKSPLTFLGVKIMVIYLFSIIVFYFILAKSYKFG